MGSQRVGHGLVIEKQQQLDASNTVMKNMGSNPLNFGHLLKNIETPI